MNMVVFGPKVIPRIRAFIRLSFRPRYLLYTNLTISMSLSGVGDFLEQRCLTRKVDKWDTLRTGNMMVSGITVGLVSHYWYLYLDKFLPGKKIGLVMKKVVLDQLIVSPLCIATFFATLAVLEGSTLKLLLEEIKQKSLQLYLAEWIIWPPAQFINFYFLTTKYRVLFDSTISLGYDIYTSYVKHTVPLNVEQAR